MKKLFVLSAILFLVPVLASASVIFVPMNAPTIQAGIDMAEDGDIVSISPGVYTGEGNYHINFKGKAITVKGSGTSTCFVEGHPSLGREGFLFKNNEGRDSKLTKLTIRNFKGIYNSAIYCESASPTIEDCYIVENIGGFGGAVALAKSNAKFIKCHIRSNEAVEWAGSTGQGGGVYIYEGSPEFINCSIMCNCSEGDGGGLYSLNAIVYMESCNVIQNVIRDEYRETKGCGIFAENSKLELKDCLIHNNDEADFGGALYALNSSGFLNDCEISYNHSYEQGGGMYFDESTLVVQGCKIKSNKSVNGAAVYVSGGSPQFSDSTISKNIGDSSGAVELIGSEAVIKYCDFLSNTAYMAAGLMIEDGCPQIFNCLFEENKSEDLGGAMGLFSSNALIRYCDFVGNTGGYGGGISIWNGSYPLITSCEFIGNYAYSSGGGLHSGHMSSATTRNCLFSKNRAEVSGGGIYCSNSETTITNCTIADNLSGSGAGLYCEEGIYLTVLNSILFRNEPDQIHGKITVSYSDIQDGYPGDHNIKMKPLFTSGPLGDYYLTTGPGFVSPCIDAGKGLASHINVHGLIYMNHLTTRSDELTDKWIVDMGYHYKVSN